MDDDTIKELIDTNLSKLKPHLLLHAIYCATLHYTNLCGEDGIPLREVIDAIETSKE